MPSLRSVLLVTIGIATLYSLRSSRHGAPPPTSHAVSYQRKIGHGTEITQQSITTEVDNPRRDFVWSSAVLQQRPALSSDLRLPFSPSQAVYFVTKKTMNPSVRSYFLVALQRWLPSSTVHTQDTDLSVEYLCEMVARTQADGSPMVLLLREESLELPAMLRGDMKPISRFRNGHSPFEQCFQHCNNMLLMPVPHTYHFMDKHLLASVINEFEQSRQLKRCMVEDEDENSVIPFSVLFPDDCDGDAWRKKIRGRHGPWILKNPVEHHTFGLEIVASLESWTEDSEVCPQANSKVIMSRVKVGQSTTNEVVAQQLVEPFLMEGKYKLGITLYVLIASTTPNWVVLWRNFMHHRSFVEYQHNSTEKHVHFTNREVQVKSSKELRNVTNRHFTTLQDWSLSPEQLEAEISKSGILSGAELHSHLLNEHKKLVRRTFLAFKKSGLLSRHCGSFMFMRWDAVLDKNLNLKLLEINNSPSLGSTVHLLRHFTSFQGKPSAFAMFNDAVDIVMELKANPRSRQFNQRVPLNGSAADFWRWNIAYDEAADIC
eukprot:TRINITY_DN61328_c0_g1_i1.p1 TRINITY_DN61328_c0_g1~~TRINITY_DN61328_c0_g1_i1.p1  ORF type:complete len:544 (-),score=18.40 TRINITY_DN61328_c0_g1_i1:165-1796(-)